MLPPQCSNRRLVKRLNVLVTKNAIILNCVNVCKVFTNITAIPCLMCQNTHFTGVNLGPLRNVFAPAGVSSCLRACFRYFIFKLRIKQGVKSFVLFLTKNFIFSDMNFIKGHVV